MIKLLLYCTKDKNNRLYRFYGNKYDIQTKKQEEMPYPDFYLNGKIVAECECEKVEEIICSKISNGVGFDVIYDTCELSVNELHKKSCLNFGYLYDYLFENNGYALHLSNLKIFDKPLSFDKDYIYKDYKSNALITKAPQNMCNVYDRFGNHYVLISIQPQHLVNILNGKKTIEIRKQILNCLKELIKK